jgi:hypothetical protein
MGLAKKFPVELRSELMMEGDLKSASFNGQSLQGGQKLAFSADG